MTRKGGYRSGGRQVIVAGNIRDTAMLEVLDKIKRNDIVVLELSSWQLEGLGVIKKSPHIAVVTNLYPDHLNRYKTLADYYDSKKEIWRYQNKDDFLVLNGRDKILRSWSKQSKSQVVFFDKSVVIPSPPLAGEGSRLSVRRRFLTPLRGVRNDKKELVTRWGQHNVENTAAAATVAGLLGVRDAVVKKVLSKPPKLSGRQEIIARKGGVMFINDTCATSPEAGIAALKRFGQMVYRHPERSPALREGRDGVEGSRGNPRGYKQILLIAGGADKNLKYDEWAGFAKKYCREIYLLVGEASDKMAKALSGFKRAHAGYSNLRAVLKEAQAMSRPGDIILFSPAAASFNLWTHEFERGEDFARQVKGLEISAKGGSASGQKN